MAAIFSKQYKMFSFDHTKALVTKFDLGIKWVKVNPGHNLNDLISAHVHTATNQVSRPFVYWFWRRTFFRVFTIYGCGGHVGHVTRTI